MLNPKFSAN